MENEKARWDDAIITMHHVSKKIRGVLVLNDINLKLSGGKIYGFKGKNGSGKTMLMRMIAGLILPSEGEVWIREKRLHRDISVPESIGILLENPSFLNDYTGFQNLKMLAGLNLNLKDAEIRNLLEKVGLKKEMNKKFGKYSLGMKQLLQV